MICLTCGSHNLTQISKIDLDPTKKHLAFSTDSGVVGVVDLTSLLVAKMKEQHTSVSLTLVI